LVDLLLSDNFDLADSFGVSNRSTNILGPHSCDDTMEYL
jgi:hypothetical protein